MSPRARSLPALEVAVRGDDHATVGELSAAAVAVLAQPEREVLVQVDGVSGLREYAEVTRLLGAATGVRAVTLVESSGSQASFAVQARGGADGLAAGLAGSPRLRPVDSASDRLVYALEP